MMSSSRHFDVIALTDVRFPGGTAASLAEEIVAQSRAGYRTGVLHVPSAMIDEPLRMNPRLRRVVRSGHAQLVIGPEPVRCNLLVVRHPSVLDKPIGDVPEISAEQTVLVANQPPRDGTQEDPFYDVPTVHERLSELVGREVAWSPISPSVRRDLSNEPWAPPMAASDWVNVVDPAAWWVERPGPRGDRPVIGRHSRPSFRKWPETSDHLRACYPDDGSFEVHVLGGASAVRDVLGFVPETWHVRPCNSAGVRQFLASIDFFVYYCHSGWREAFGRAVLEALASGAVAVLPSHFRELFGDGAVYASPSEVRTKVLDLHRDAEAFTAQSRRALGVVEERYSHQIHVDRIGRRIGPPRHTSAEQVHTPAEQVHTSADQGHTSAVRSSPGSGPIGRTSRSSTASGALLERPRILLLSSNGSGVGHLIRTLAVARRCFESVPVIVTLSQGVSVARRLGIPAEHLAFADAAGLTTSDWHRLAHSRLLELVGQHDPSALVFDGTWPYPGLIRFHEDTPDLPKIWSRRGMWRPGTPTTALEREWAFSKVLEPGELAGSHDRGPTTDPSATKASAQRLDPLVILRPDELLDRSEARDELGLTERPTALVQLGAGNINDLGPTLQPTIESLDAYGFDICLTRSAIARQAAVEAEHVHTVQHYPLMRCLRAFDLAVAASGYNTFHELTAAAVPTLWVPNEQTATDDQDARARWAVEAGTGLRAPEGHADVIRDKIGELADPQRREAMRREARARWPEGDGAAQMLAEVTAVAGVRP